MKNKNELFKEIKKSVFLIVIFLAIGLLFANIFEARAEVGEEERMQHLWEMGRIDDDEYEAWLEDYEEQQEKGAEWTENFLTDPLGAITGIFDTIGNFFADRIKEWIKDILNLIDYRTVTKTALNPESEFNVFSVIYAGLYNLFLTLSLSLVILKTLLYGFNAYILWRNGSPDENPFEIIVRHLFAMAMMLSFHEIYTIIGNISIDILDKINEIVTPTASVDFIDLVLNFIFGSGVGASLIFLIFYLIEYIKAIITTAGKGIELFIFRIGAPLACVSATTPQAGVFNQYTMAIIKSILSIFMMVICLNLSVSIIVSRPNLTGLLWATASLKLVNKGSALLSQFTTSPNQTGGGGMGGMLLQAGRAVITTATTGTPK